MPAAAPSAACGNPDALGVSRVVEIDTAGGPGFGFEQFKAYDFLREHEVVLTFDDGPWPGNTPAVLKALADQCTKALFFPIGKHAMWHPEILKQVAAAGHTIGSHTWSHADLSKLTIDQAKEEFEKGASAVRAALGEPGASFFRFPALRAPTGDGHLSRDAKHRHLLDRYGLLRLQDSQAGAGHCLGDEEARESAARALSSYMTSSTRPRWRCQSFWLSSRRAATRSCRLRRKTR